MFDLGTQTVDAKELASGEVTPGTPWYSVETVKLYTNCFIVDEPNQRILLGYKKRGFGKGMHNGFGGKVDVGETPAQAALRELTEEAGITSDLTHAGTLLFTSAADTMMHHIEIYRGDSWSGDITESDEMRPEWFPLNSIPFDNMWSDDCLWFSYLLEKRPFVGRVDFGVPKTEGDLNSADMTKWWFGEPATRGPLAK